MAAAACGASELLDRGRAKAMAGMAGDVVRSPPYREGPAQATATRPLRCGPPRPLNTVRLARDAAQRLRIRRIWGVG
jgi:hypothetical protein